MSIRNGGCWVLTLLALMTGGCASPTQSDNGGSTSKLTSPGTCSLTPNYISAGPLSRWFMDTPQKLTIIVSVTINRSLSGLSSAAADGYVNGANFGAGLWPTAMFGANLLPFLDIQVTSNNASAPIQISLSETASAGSPNAEADTTFTFSTIGGRQFINGAQITYRRPGTSTAELLLQRGVWKQAQFEGFMANTIAHEMGHALGIRSHSPNSPDLMTAGGNRANGEIDYQNWITRADVNTLSHAYCQ